MDNGFEDTPFANEAVSEKTASDGAPPSRVGRYIILRRLGVGGMGAVYGAYDPKLNRRVALKLLRPDLVASLGVRRRLLREARSLARLSHPNVVQVHDVDVLDDDVYVVMEFIQGRSLREFAKADPKPSWRRVLDAYLDAAHGLAAAHDKGLVHRDFKPANVLIDQDGCVKVLDFGLAAGLAASNADDTVDMDLDVEALEASRASEPTVERADGHAIDATLRDQQLTVSGVVMGTPAYMAPEQHEGGDIGVAADIYGFSASLYEGLYDVMPFPADSQGWKLSAQRQLLRRKLRREVAQPAAPSDVPPWLHAAVMRGLEPEPEDRWPSMNAFIAALKDDPIERRRARLRMLGLAGALVGLIGLALLGWLRKSDAAPTCADATRDMAGVWDARISATVRERFQLSGSVHALESHDRLASILDSYTDSWVAMKNDVCAATYVRKVQSPRLFDLRMQCLERHHSRLAALTAILANAPDRELIDRSVEAALALPELASCADERALSAAYPPPHEPDKRALAAALEQRLDLAETLEQAGRYRLGQNEAESVLVEARALDYPPLSARAMFAVARASKENSDNKRAEAVLREAFTEAARAKDDRLLAQLFAELIELLGVSDARPDDAMALRLPAETAALRAGDELVRARLLLTLGMVLDQMGSYEEALALDQRVLEIRAARLGPDHLDTAEAHSQIGNVRYSMGQYQAAHRAYERALEIRERALGSHHPVVANALNNVGIAAMEMGDFERARAHHERALDIRRALFGDNHSSIAASLNNLGLVLQRMGDYQQSRDLHERALAMREKLLGPNHPLVASALIKLGYALFATGRYREAGEHYQRTREILTAVHGEEHPEVALVLEHQAELALARGDLPGAGNLYQRALDIMERTYGADHPYSIQALTGLARTATAGADYDHALELLQRALAIQERVGGLDQHDAIPILMALGERHNRSGAPDQAVEHWQRARDMSAAKKSGYLSDCEFGLAQALAADPSRRDQARELAESAAAGYRRIDHQAKLQRAEHWLREFD